MLSFEDGVHFLAADLHVDARRARPRAVVSHAHSDHVGRHQRWVATPGTAALCARRWGARELEVRGFHEPWSEGDAIVTLLPAGHILGSAMVLVERDGLRVLYTGDFRLAPAATAERCQPVRADVLVMECTFGEPRFRFPDRETVLDELCEFIASTLARGATPVLLAYSLGKAQEVARLLGERGVPAMLHPSAWQMLEVYREQGVTFPLAEPYARQPPRGALIVPPHLAKSAAVRRLTRRRTAFVSGWAMDPRRATWARADVAFPLSDHADFDELVEMVARVAPRKVYTLHGPESFSDRLRAMGHDAEPAGRRTVGPPRAPAVQLSLL
jgi:Cft2 family RNA processing exonuclease